MSNTTNSFRENVFEYVNKKYKSEIEYLWAKYPEDAIFRNNENRKWYGIVMEIPYKKLGINKDSTVVILNVKIDDIILKDLLIQQDGIFNAYHMKICKWISVLLDGSVDISQIYHLIDLSFAAVSSKTKKK